MVIKHPIVRNYQTDEIRYKSRKFNKKLICIKFPKTGTDRRSLI